MRLYRALTDKDTSPTLNLRLWNILTGVLLFAFASFWFSPQEQGFYFTFLSLAALQVFFELGLNYVATQIVAHDAAHVVVTDGHSVTNPHQVRIGQVFRFLKKWYAFAAPAFFCLATLSGYFFFYRQSGIHIQDWLIPWVLLVLFTSINLYLSPVFAVAEGMGEVGAVARFRLKQSIVGHGLMWTGLSLGYGLWSTWIVSATGTLSTLYFLKKGAAFTRHLNLGAVRGPVIDRPFQWKTELLPMQWRIALSWASGYLLFQSLTPIIMLNQGPAEAAKVGLAIAGFNAVISLGVSLLNAKGPAIAMLIARNDVTRAKQLYAENSLISIGLVALGSGAIIAVAVLSRDSIFQGRVLLPELPALFALTINSLVNSVVFSAAVFMRAHKVEPMAAVSFVGGLVSMVIFYIGSLYSTTYAVVSYTAVTTLLILPWTLVILRRFTAVSHG